MVRRIRDDGWLFPLPLAGRGLGVGVPSRKRLDRGPTPPARLRRAALPVEGRAGVGRVATDPAISLPHPSSRARCSASAVRRRHGIFRLARSCPRQDPGSALHHCMVRRIRDDGVGVFRQVTAQTAPFPLPLAGRGLGVGVLWRKRLGRGPTPPARLRRAALPVEGRAGVGRIATNPVNSLPHPSSRARCSAKRCTADTGSSGWRGRARGKIPDQHCTMSWCGASGMTGGCVSGSHGRTGAFPPPPCGEGFRGGGALAQTSRSWPHPTRAAPPRSPPRRGEGWGRPCCNGPCHLSTSPVISGAPQTRNLATGEAVPVARSRISAQNCMLRRVRDDGCGDGGWC